MNKRESEIDILYERWKDGELTDKQIISLLEMLDENSLADSDNADKINCIIRWIVDENNEGMDDLRAWASTWAPASLYGPD